MLDLTLLFGISRLGAVVLCLELATIQAAHNYS